MNLRKQGKNPNAPTRPLSENILKCMDPETRKKMGQLTAREAQEKWQKDTEKKIHVDVTRECLRQRITVLEPPMHKRSMFPRGHPDMTLLKNGYSMLLELKAEGGRLSNDQIDRIAELEKCGNETIIAWSAKEAIEAIHAWLVRIGAR